MKQAEVAEKVVLVKPSAQAAAKLKMSLPKKNGRSVTAAVKVWGPQSDV
ncbi:MAG: hypothetical protein H0X54_09375 [Propionibacteriales bacterium]|nr:hypothetical protein [Propionibacteriales bacterium]